MQTRSKRDPGEIHRPRCPCGAAREGRARGQPTQKARAARVRVAGSRTATGARQRSAGEKQRGGVSLAPNGPVPATEAPALLPPLDDVCDYRAAHVDPDPAVGVGPVRERRHEQPPLGAPAVRSERLRVEGGIGDERCTVVAAVGARGRRRACAAPTMSRNSGSSAKRQRVIAVMGLMMSRTTRQVGQCQQLCLFVNSTSHQIGNERACLVVESGRKSSFGAA